MSRIQKNWLVFFLQWQKDSACNELQLEFKYLFDPLNKDLNSRAFNLS